MTPFEFALVGFLGGMLSATLLFTIGKALGRIENRTTTGGIWTEGGNEHLRGQD